MNQNVVTMILKNGNATGIIQCNLDEWIGVSYKIPRSKIKEAKELKGINNTGVYILFGVDETTGENRAYIGEAEDIYVRLLQHNKNKQFWSECIVFVSQDNSLNKAHIKFIENELYMKAKNINRYLIENNSKPTKSTLDGADEIRAIKFLEKVMLLTSVYGYHMFDEILKEEFRENLNDLLYLTNNNIEYAKGILTDEGFVILKGSKIKSEIAKSLSPSLIKYAERERNSKDIKDNVFINDHLCSTPSMAAVIILGRNSNGYNEWKNKEGVRLKDLIN